MSERKPSAKTARALAQARTISAQHRGLDELEAHSTGKVRLYGAFDGVDDVGCQDYTKSIELQGVRVVDEKWLLSIVDQRARLLASADRLMARGFFKPSSCADEATNADMAEMRAAIDESKGARNDRLTRMGQ